MPSTTAASVPHSRTSSSNIYRSILVTTLCTLALSTPITSESSQPFPRAPPPFQRRTDTAFTPFGFQSGSGSSSYGNDDSYAGSISIDEENGVLYLTGGTYGYYFNSSSHSGDTPENGVHLDQSQCFVSVLKLPDSDKSTDLQLVYSRRFGTESNAEVCSAVHYLQDPNSALKRKIVTIGHTQGSDGFFTSLRRTGSDISKVYGFVMDFDVNLNLDSSEGQEDDNSDAVSTPTTGTLNGGMLFHENKVQYPVAFVSSPYIHTENDGSKDTADIYVLMLESDTDSENDAFTSLAPGGNNKNHDHPDLTAGGGGGVQQYGSIFDMTIKKLSWKSDSTLAAENPTIEGIKRMLYEDWSRTYSPDDDEDVMASSLLYITADGSNDDALVVAGSTRGSGKEFGRNDPSETMDGFVTKLVLPSSGSPPASISTTSSPLTSKNDDGSGKDMIVSAMCANQEMDITEFFVVGSVGEIPEGSDGSSSILHAFITKIDAEKLSPVWSKELGAVKDHGSVLGIGCAVTSDGKDVYLAGTVTNGAVVDLSKEDVYPVTRSFGGDDVFIAKFDAGEGQLAYAKQMGTREDEFLARGGNGGGIVTDTIGNAILMGTTRGSFMRKKTSDEKGAFADVFLVSVSRETGEFQESIDKGAKVAHGKSKVSGFGVAFTVISIITIVVCMLILHKEKLRDMIHQKFGKDNGEANVSQFLDDFGDVDVEIRHSATGGFHGMYDFPDRSDDDTSRAGHEGVPPDEVTVSLSLISPTDATSTVKESLFLDDDDHVVLTSGGNNDDDNDDDVLSATNDIGDSKKSRGRKMRKSRSAGSYSQVNTDDEAFTIDDEDEDDEDDAMSTPNDIDELKKKKKKPGRKLGKSKSAGKYSQVNTEDDTMEESEPSEDRGKSSKKKTGERKKDVEVADDHVPLVEGKDIV